MKRYLLIFLASVFFLQGSIAQDRKWEWMVNGSKSRGSSSNAMTMDSERNIYVVGWFDGNFEIDDVTLTGKGSNDIFLVKLKENGDLIWARGLGGPNFFDLGYAVTVDKQDNVIITGSFDINAVVGSETLTSTYYRDVITVKYDKNGNILWIRQGKGTGAEDYGYAIKADSLDNVYVAGINSGVMNFEGTSIEQGGFITKYDPSGNLIKIISIPGQSTEVTSISFDRKENILAVGMFTANTAFENITIPGVTGWRTFLAKYNSSGDIEWIKTPIANPGSATVKEVVTDEFGNSYIGGMFMDTIIVEKDTLTNQRKRVVTFNPLTMKFDTTYSMIWNAFIAKYDSSGVFKWIKKIGSEQNAEVRGLFCDQKGGVFISGIYMGKTKVGNAEFDSNTHTGYFCKMDYNGNFEFAEDIKSTSGFTVYLEDVYAIKGTYYITGLASQLKLGDFEFKNDISNPQFFIAKNSSKSYAPEIKSFSPSYVAALDSVTVKGKYFTGVTDVFLGSESLSFTIVSDSVLRFKTYLASVNKFSLVNQGGTTFSSTPLEVVFVTGIKSAESESIVAYPNPANNILYFKGLNNPGQISIMSIDGMMLKKISTSEVECSLNVEDISKGTYLFVFEGNTGGRKVGKITIIK
ncbi:T9SS type A sorting domain-containing protein [Sporocytophaga myxococcoides]|uniref:T9SS type A sorting domain-containing protein n=1 Tax=Sporocytophaga myxococcoides TaxID=153721 RepID=UPI00048A9BB6|nr:T9SS type A sorting domain-containing protein [Sporocytophaga myxococcoides]